MSPKLVPIGRDNTGQGYITRTISCFDPQLVARQDGTLQALVTPLDWS